MFVAEGDLCRLKDDWSTDETMCFHAKVMN